MPTGIPDEPDVFGLLFEHHPEPMWIYDLHTLRFLAVNNAAVEQYGYSRNEFAGMDITQIRPPADRAQLQANLAEPRSDLQHSGIWLHRRGDGSLLHVEVTSHVLTYAGCEAALVVGRDVSQRVESERRRDQLLRETEAARHALEVQTRNFDVMFEQMADPVMLFDANGRVERMNQAARAIFTNNAPVAPGTVSSATLAERYRMRDEHANPIPADDLPVMRVLRGETLTGARAFDAQVGPRSRPIFVNISGAPIRDQNDQIIGAVMVSRDVTERRQLEQQARAALRELNQRMEAFLSIAGHEMRTPLTSLLGNIQLAARALNELDFTDGSLPVSLEQLKVLVYRMERQGRVLNSLVNNVLEASAVSEPDPFDLQRIRFDMQGVVHDVVEDARPQMRGRSIDTQLAGDGGALLVEGDRERIAQVLSHFLANAHKFSPVDEPIHVGATGGTDSVHVWVADHGPGVPAVEHDRIWNRFYRVDGLSHVSGSSVGLGLGLYLSRRIVERHGGRVGLDTPSGGGATFWFRLPLIRTAGGVAFEPPTRTGGLATR